MLLINYRLQLIITDNKVPKTHLKFAIGIFTQVDRRNEAVVAQGEYIFT
jgi:hypothetical protein